MRGLHKYTLCPCGSGLKVRHCCLNQKGKKRMSRLNVPQNNGGLLLPTPEQKQQAMGQAIMQTIMGVLNYRDTAAREIFTSRITHNGIFPKEVEERTKEAKDMAEKLAVEVGLAPSVEWFRQWDDRNAILETVKAE